MPIAILACIIGKRSQVNKLVEGVKVKKVDIQKKIDNLEKENVELQRHVQEIEEKNVELQRHVSSTLASAIAHSSKLGINLSALLGVPHVVKPSFPLVLPIFDELKPDLVLQESCKQLCQEFTDLFKPELGPRVVPFAIQDELCQANDAGIAGGAAIAGKRAKLWVCRDYSITVNHQLEPNCHPMPLPEDLMRKLGGGYGFTKIDLADANNQIMLAPESPKCLALSTHQGEMMDQLTSDLRGVAVYIDDTGWTTASEHLQNLHALLQRLESKGLHCHLKSVFFAQLCVEYLGHILSGQRTAKGPKVNDVMRMPAPGNVSGVRSFLGSVLFYSKFLPNLAMLTEPLHRLTKKDTPWRSKLPSKRSRIYFVKTTFLSTSIHLSRLGSLVMPGQQ
ncbi:hypothetical protein EMCRGX_G034953 [Ephydatia muelleri]